MWISKKKFKKIEDRLYKLEFQSKAYFKQINALNGEIMSLSSSIENLETNNNSKKELNRILHG